jgi:hypothetical protein
LPELNTNGYELEEVKARIDNTFRLKVIERSTSAASHVDVPGELFGSPSYGSLRKAYEKAVEAVGLPPFTITLGKKARRAETFGELKSLTLELAKEGIQVARFKGLGEMDPAELWDTTMDPARRMLMRVEVEDAAEADRIFSMLMGDQVEPRREFIEQNARTCVSSMSDLERLGAGRIEGRELEQEMRSSFLDYAMSVIVSRALLTCATGSSPCTADPLRDARGRLQPNRPG